MLIIDEVQHLLSCNACEQRVALKKYGEVADIIIEKSHAPRT
jgi:hypothetical protein